MHPDLLGRLVRRLMERHPLPWRTEQDWTAEVIAADGSCVLKCMNEAEAEELHAVTRRLRAEDEEGERQLRALGLGDLLRDQSPETD